MPAVRIEPPQWECDRARQAPTSDRSLALERILKETNINTNHLKKKKKTKIKYNHKKFKNTNIKTNIKTNINTNHNRSKMSFCAVINRYKTIPAEGK